ncbi:hypothetical protein FIBSPDRAFT_939432 [Athelia psychrophila]|uniref:WD40 repeat-like protein n=1 Tax=Athelia psychrophila TaxID=1759441 RepID=A0A165WD09_9AGAM|nr:hypothetical protein FIBSPDRAFT_939432 [Fibularhizoctonia sp. CBS 109695]
MPWDVSPIEAEKDSESALCESEKPTVKAIVAWLLSYIRNWQGPFHAPGKVTSVAFSPDGKRIASTSLDGKTIHIFDMPTDASSSSVQGFKSSSRLVNGRMQNSPTELLFWAHRTGLWRPNSTMVIGRQSTRLDLTKSPDQRRWEPDKAFLRVTEWNNTAHMNQM